MTTPNLINDRYQIIRPLGRGGLGQTYLATDTWQNVDCALKEFAPGPSISASNLAKAQQLFHREAKVLRQLNHHQISAYLDSFSWKSPTDEQPRLFLVQQYIDGATYQHHLQRRPFTEAQTLQFLQDILPILDYLHGHSPQVIHRDIAPDNIIFDPDLGKPVLIDFGSVKQAIATATSNNLSGGTSASEDPSGNSPKTVKTIIAKAGFTAPEQAHGAAYPSSDIYALGMSAIALLTGSTNPAELAPHQWQANLTEGFARLIQRMAHPMPNQRFANAGAVIQAIQTLQGSNHPVPPAPNHSLFPIGNKTILQKASPYELKPEHFPAGSPESGPGSGPEYPSAAATAASPATVKTQPVGPAYAAPAASLGQPASAAPGSEGIARTVAVGSPLKNSVPNQTNSGATFTSEVKEIYPWYLLPFVKTQRILAFLLYRLVAPSIALLCLFGLGRAAVLRLMLPQIAQIEAPSLPKFPSFSLPEFSLPKVSLPEISLPSASGSSGADCRNDVIKRADKISQQRSQPLNWEEVDQRFRYANPGFTEAIDPENPDHGPYIESWCGVANEWLNEES